MPHISHSPDMRVAEQKALAKRGTKKYVCLLRREDGTWYIAAECDKTSLAELWCDYQPGTARVWTRDGGIVFAK
jgi:hypothetical protein